MRSKPTKFTEEEIAWVTYFQNELALIKNLLLKLIKLQKKSERREDEHLGD